MIVPTKVLSRLTILFLGLGLASGLYAQTFILDNFGGGGDQAAGSLIGGTSWATGGNLAINANDITVQGTAGADSGWGYAGAQLADLTSYTFLALTAKLSVGNTATDIFVTFDDGGASPQTIQFLASSFNTSTFTTVYIPVTWTIDPTTVEAWNIGGGLTPPAGPSPAFRMTFDKLALTTAIPEPSTYAAMAGALALGLAVWRRRNATRA